MSNWAVPPAITTAYATLVSLFKDRDNELAVGMDPARVTVTNPITYTIRWNSASNKWELFNGSWGDLSAAYAISVTGTAANITGVAAAVNGGTGYAAFAVGDLLAANTTTTLAKVPDVATGNALLSGGVNTLPFYGKVTLTGHVSGILPGANGGTNNGFMAFTGPATALRTFTLPNASATILTSNAVVTVPQGGSGVASLTGLVKGNGASAMSAAVAGTDYVVPGLLTGSGLTLNTGKLIGRTTAAVGASEEISVGAGLTLSAGSLAASVTSVNGQTGAVNTTTHLGVGAVQVLFNFSRTTIASGSTAVSAASLGYVTAAPSSGTVFASSCERSGDVTVPGAALNTNSPTTAAVTGTWQSMSWSKAATYDSCAGKTVALPALFVRVA